MSGKLHMVPALVNDKYVIRFAVCAQNANDDDITFAWNVTSEMATEVIEACDSNKESEAAIERLASLELEEEEGVVPNGVILEDLGSEQEKAEPEEEDEVFLYDDNIPSIPSLPTRYDVGRSIGLNPNRRRNLLLRMISDPKCYNPRVLRSLTQDGKPELGKRQRSDSAKQAASDPHPSATEDRQQSSPV